jgi:hypothetical protein
MPTYCVDNEPGPDGTHEVHNVELGRCDRLPEPASRIDVGYHTSAHGAVAKAKKQFRRVNGCPRCCPEAHALVVDEAPTAKAKSAAKPPADSPRERSKRPRAEGSAGR